MRYLPLVPLALGGLLLVNQVCAQQGGGSAPVTVINKKTTANQVPIRGTITVPGNVSATDVGIILFLNQFAQRSKAFDSAIVFISHNNLLKGGCLVLMLWWIWFRADENQNRNRQVILSMLLACFLSVFIAKVLALVGPFRLRPLHTPELAFKVPYTLGPKTLDGWNSFPSDHAALFFAFGSGYFFISRLVGTVALTHVLAVICLPRIYLGLHFPTDIIGGALIGAGVTAYVVKNTTLKRILEDTVLAWEHRSSGSFYACFFILTWQVADLFEDLLLLKSASETMVLNVLGLFV